MTHMLYQVDYISSSNRDRPIFIGGRLTSAHAVIDRITRKFLLRYKRQQVGAAKLVTTEDDTGVHRIVEIRVKAHQFKTRKIVRHFRVSEREI